MEEFICDDNFVFWQDVAVIVGKDFVEIRNKNDKYSASGYICLEEKEYIVEMLNRIKKEMFRTDKFTYQEGDIKIVDCQCELCNHYNNRKRIYCW